MTLTDIVAIPALKNYGLSYCPEYTMLSKFGSPGPLGNNCALPDQLTIKNASWMRTEDVGPFTVTGMHVAVELLKRIFAEVLVVRPDVYDGVKQAGMLCCRHKSLNLSAYSNHSWGTAIDLYFGTQVYPQGSARCERGISQLVPFFNKYGFYWGGGFSGGSVDSMHFELSYQWVSKVQVVALAWETKLAPYV